MINFNAAQISLTAIGMPAQQNPNNITAGNNNFQTIIADILNGQLSSEKADIASAISVDPAAKNALFQSISTLYLLGKIEAVSNLSTGEIINDPAVNTVIENNNLNPQQAQLLAGGIKITAVEITAGNIPVLNNAAVLLQAQGTAPVSALPVTAVDSAAAVNTSINDSAVPAAPVVLSVLNPDIAAAVLQPAVTVPVSQSAVVTPAILNSPASTAPVTITAPVIITASAANPVQAGAQPAVVVPLIDNSGAKPITTSAVEPAVKPVVVPAALNTLAGKIQEINSSAAVEDANKLTAELKNIIKDFTALIYKMTEKNENVPAEARLINNKVTELANKLNELNKVPLNNTELVKAITNEAADMLAAISAALYRMTEVYMNTVPVNSADSAAGSKTDVLINSQTGSQDGYSSNRQVTVAAGLTDEAKGLITQIYGLLKKMNGELYMQQKTDYVYQPFSGSSSQVTKDGVLLINTAASGAVRPEVVADALPKAATVVPQAVVLSETGAISSEAVKSSASASGAVKFSPSAISITEEETIADAVKQSKIVQAVIDSNKAAALIAESKSSYVKDVNWLQESINTTIVSLNGKADLQLPVSVKVFEQAADIAGRTKESIVIKQVVQNIQNAVQVTGKTEIKMFLRPDNMGPVIIKIDSNDKVLSGRIEVANVDVKDILKANLPELKAALLSMGLNVNNLDVSIMSGYIGSGLQDSSANQYAEWEGSAVRPDVEETIEKAGALNGVDGYLNFLA